MNKKHIDKTLEEIQESIEASALNTKSKQRAARAIGKAQNAAAAENPAEYKKALKKAVNELSRELLN